MAVTSLIPAAAGILFLLFGLTVSIKEKIQTRKLWIWPLILSLLFLVLSVLAVVTEGPLGFWAEHTRNLWGNQI
jgi:energy-coupling factor transporter transmembrane protein EcfT